MDRASIFAPRMSRMKASEIRDLLKLLDQPGTISFGGRIPDPALLPVAAWQNALARDMPQGVTWTRPEGGMFVWLTLPEKIDGADLLAHALKHEKVAFVPGRAFFADGSNGNTIRLSFSLHEKDVADEGIRRIGQAIRAMP